MLATILFPIPLAVLPIVLLPQPTRDCWLEVLTPQAIEERALTEFGTNALWGRNLVLLDVAANLVLDVGIWYP